MDASKSIRSADQQQQPKISSDKRFNIRIDNSSVLLEFNSYTVTVKTEAGGNNDELNNSCISKCTTTADSVGSTAKGEGKLKLITVSSAHSKFENKNPTSDAGTLIDLLSSDNDSSSLRSAVTGITTLDSEDYCVKKESMENVTIASYSSKANDSFESRKSSGKRDESTSAEFDNSMDVYGEFDKPLGCYSVSNETKDRLSCNNDLAESSSSTLSMKINRLLKDYEVNCPSSSIINYSSSSSSKCDHYRKSKSATRKMISNGIAYGVQRERLSFIKMIKATCEDVEEKNRALRTQLLQRQHTCWKNWLNNNMEVAEKISNDADECNLTGLKRLRDKCEEEKLKQTQLEKRLQQTKLSIAERKTELIKLIATELYGVVDDM